MTVERLIDQSIDLLEYIPPDHFRTVDSFEMQKAPSETNVEIELKDSFIRQLDFKVPWGGKLYAYARHTQSFLKLCADDGIAKKDIYAIYLEDWDDKFLMAVETADKKRQLLFFVSIGDMLSLLKNCCRVPSQK